ncbi:MAG: ABC transporter ATP-binding protein [Flavobacteriales bacterium]|nr:ABC transporter ATP-binding protein [Flavobacteriales bacterium]
MSVPVIRVQGLVKQYRNADGPAVNGMDLNVMPGEFLGLLGPNGAGKTTIISIITGVRQPTSGTVSIQGIPITRDAHEVHRIIGYVPQDIALYEALTARENLTFFGELVGLSGQRLRQRSDELLERTGLLARAGERVKDWSGGMKRRLNLIVALLHEPAILFLDEPTVGIDVQSRAAIWELLHEINATGTTVVYTSHHLEEAERLCSRVVIIDNGRAVGEVSDPQAHKGHLEETFMRMTGRGLRD